MEIKIFFLAIIWQSTNRSIGMAFFFGLQEVQEVQSLKVLRFFYLFVLDPNGAHFYIILNLDSQFPWKGTD